MIWIGLVIGIIIGIFIGFIICAIFATYKYDEQIESLARDYNKVMDQLDSLRERK